MSKFIKRINQLPQEETVFGAIAIAITLVFLLLLQSVAYSQTGNHVFEGAESVNFGVINLATPAGQTWSTFRGATPGYFSAVGTATYTGAADADANVNGYVKHYANDANQAFTFPVGTGSDLRELSVSGTRNAAAILGVAWIAGDPSTTSDPTGPNSGTHAITSTGTGITAVSPVGFWDWQDLSNDAAGSTVTVSVPDMSAFATADNLRLVGWNGTTWVNLSGTTGASGNTENSTLSGTMVSGITALGIGAGEAFIDFGDNSTFASVAATYTDANNDGVPDGTGSVWLGSSVSSDLADSSNAAGTGDASGDDGLGMPPTNGGTIDHTVTLSAASATTVHYYVRMVTSSSTINLTGSHTFAASGDTTITLSPAALIGYTGTIDYRVVVASSAADAAAAITGNSFTNGEIEDYQRTYTNPLPVELLYLTAVWQGEDAVLDWATASELNNSHYNIERSFDGKEFTYIGTEKSIAETGNSNEILNYSFVDPSVKNLVDKHVYYRLVQTDYNGTTEVLGPVVLDAIRATKPSISTFPVPATDYVTVQTKALVEGDIYTLNIIDNLGKTVQQTTFEAGENHNNSILNISSLPKGVYWIQIDGSHGALQTQKFIKIQ